MVAREVEVKPTSGTADAHFFLFASAIVERLLKVKACCSSRFLHSVQTIPLGSGGMNTGSASCFCGMSSSRSSDTRESTELASGRHRARRANQVESEV